MISTWLHPGDEPVALLTFGVATSNCRALQGAALTGKLGIRAQVVGAPAARYFVPAGLRVTPPGYIVDTSTI